MSDTPTTITHRLPAERSIMAGPFGSSDSLDHAWRVATALQGSPLVPEAVRNPHAILAAIHIASTHGEDLFSVLQAIQLIKGKVGFSGTYLLARVNRSGMYPEGCEFVTTGKDDTLAVTMRGTRANGRVDTFTVSFAMAKLDGWTSNPKYKTIPEIMLTNRCIGFFVRYRCPEIMTGYVIADELDDRTDLVTTATVDPVATTTTTTADPTRRPAVPRGKGRSAPALPDHGIQREAEQQALDAMTAERQGITVPTGDGFDGEET